MPTREEKINAIYEKIADKTLSDGCIVKGDFTYIVCSKSTIYKSGDEYFSDYGEQGWQKINFDTHKIIGHPVMIGDVMDFLNEKIRPYGLDCGDGEFYYAEGENTAWMIDLWENKRKPIEEQSDECVDFIYNLIKE